MTLRPLMPRPVLKPCVHHPVMLISPASSNLRRIHIAASNPPRVPQALPWQMESARKATSRSSFSFVISAFAISLSLLQESPACRFAQASSPMMAARAVLDEKNMFFICLSTINDYICKLALQGVALTGRQN